MKTRKHEMAQFYREQVQKIEKEILAITNNATDVNFSDEKGAYLVALINERKEILDVMFANAVREVECIEQGYVRPDYIDSVSSKELDNGTLSQHLADMGGIVILFLMHGIVQLSRTAKRCGKERFS